LLVETRFRLQSQLLLNLAPSLHQRSQAGCLLSLLAGLLLRLAPGLRLCSTSGESLRIPVYLGDQFFQRNDEFANARIALSRTFS
jgi:hypothetical protein